MIHKGSVLIETNRLILRRFRMDDCEVMFSNWANDERVTEFLRWQPHGDIKVTNAVLSEWVDNYSATDFYQWAIVPKDNNDKPIGSIGVVEKNEKIGKVHIGYCIAYDRWNQGITTEAFAAIIDFLFREVKVNRIEAQHDPNNPNSGKVMIKCGLKQEGILRDADFSNKGIIDVAIYSILAREYFEKNG